MSRASWCAALGLLVVSACDDGPGFVQNDRGGLLLDGQQGERRSGDFGVRPPCGSDEDLAGCGCKQLGEQRACYGGPAATRKVGLCRDGSQRCDPVPAGGEYFGDPGRWSPCSGDTRPAAEVCSDKLDHDCNGAGGCSDPGCAGEAACKKQCQPGQTKPCYTGPAGTSGKGACKPGKQSCDPDGQWAPACVGEVKPAGSELFLCKDGIDNDCNGLTDCQELICLLDSGCAPQACSPGTTQPCYDGPPATQGVAACQGGTQTCAADGKGWGPCTGQVLPSPEGGHCADTLDNDCNGLADCKDPACATAPSCCVPPSGPPPDGTIYAHSPDDLYVVNPSGWTVTKLGSFGVADQITDLAVTPNGALYAVSFTSLYSVNKTTGKATYVAGVSGSGNNALTFLPGGDLLAADSSGDLKKLSPSSGTVTPVGNFGAGLSSSGDLVAVASGTLYGVSSTAAGGGDASGNNLLIRVDAASGAATVVGPIGYGSVWGLAYVNATVIGFTTSGQILKIDPQTGAGTLLATRSVAFWGAAMSPLVQANPCP